MTSPLPALSAPHGGPYRLPRPTLRVRAAVASVILGVFVVVMHVRLTGYALADIMGALDCSPDEAAWLNTAYTVAELMAIPMAGWLSSKLSARRVIVPAALGFSMASLAATQVTHLDQLVVLRAVQGFTGGTFIPMATPVFQRKLPYHHRLVAFAFYGIASSVPISLAPLVESFLVDELSWRLVFVPPALLGAIAAGLAAWGMPVIPIERSVRWIPDWSGTVLLPLGLAMIVLGTDQANRLDWFASSWVSGMSLAGVLMLLAFALHERDHARPYLPPSLWSNRNFVLGLLTFFAFRASMIGIVWALPDFLQRVQQFRPSDFTGIFAAMVLPQLVLPFLIVRASRKFDMRLVVAAGVMFQAVACLRTATLTNDWEAPELTLIFALHGVGQALFFTPILVLLTLNLEEEQRAGSVGLVNLARVFGSSVGVSIASTLVTKAEHLHHAMLNERLATEGLVAQPRLALLHEIAVTHAGADEGGRVALTLAGEALRREAFTLAYGDLFMDIGAVLVIVLLLQLLLRPISLRELSPLSTRKRRLSAAHRKLMEPHLSRPPM